jgi:RNA recognition motif-containing protein
VRDAFEEFGRLVDVQLPIDRRTGYVKGYALVQFAKKDEARAALSEMDGADLLGETLSVTWAVVKHNASGGGGGGDGGGGGGRGRQNNGGGGGGRGGRRRSKSGGRHSSGGGGNR